MSPRPYELKQRRAGMDATRTRIISAARKVLVSGDAFSFEAVAREAGVARITIYDRFGGRGALIGAIFDDLAESGGLHRLPGAFEEADPVAAIERFVAIFCGFYSVHRLLLRRLHAMAVLGRSALGGGERDARRLQGLNVLLGRAAVAGHPGADSADVVHAVHILTGFAFVDAFAGTEQDPIDVAAPVAALVRRVANLE
ncbi:MAG: TetR/AcrR family transcriptional regulator [Candidatus Dormibacteria bacterium]